VAVETQHKLPALDRGSESITLLAVSPYRDDHDCLKDMLCRGNWTVRTAESCDEAVQAVKDSTPAVVACETDLPDGNWKDLFNLLTSLQNPPPVVVLSRHADESLWAEVLNWGGYDVLAKPFDATEVSRVFEMACRYGRRG
jgi:DNA-binding NtrC family response regulator